MTRLTALERDAKGIQERLGEHHRTLYGNGHPGLFTRVDRLEQRSLSAREHLALIGAVLLGVANLVISAIAAWK